MDKIITRKITSPFGPFQTGDIVLLDLNQQPQFGDYALFHFNTEYEWIAQVSQDNQRHATGKAIFIGHT
ncbi:hypothetical protein [Algicola sagamiensis]|uniref:hypothetical protein n=1 Tax=Algicola sagamiensis TaxID=163869 RepID=UPI00037052E8|nr:hypothetical protein [Algicola sagamiensis]